MTLAEFETAWQAARGALAQFTVGEMDITHRQNALVALNEALSEARAGWQQAERERQRAEEAVVLEAYREGRVTIRPRNGNGR